MVKENAKNLVGKPKDIEKFVGNADSLNQILMHIEKEKEMIKLDGKNKLLKVMVVNVLAVEKQKLSF